MEPATAAGLALAILPLIVAALENYEYTFQPVIIYSSRYRKEVKKFQDQLKVENFVFRHECHLLLRDVTSDDIKSMLDNPKHVLWSNKELEARLEGQLNECCEACISALRLINEVLQDIAKSTGALDILLDEVRYCAFGEANKAYIANNLCSAKQESTRNLRNEYGSD